MSLGELHDITGLTGVPGPGPKNVVLHEVYVLVHDEGPARQRSAIVKLYRFTRGAYVTVQWRSMVGGDCLEHRGDYRVKVEDARHLEDITGPRVERTQYYNIGGSGPGKFSRNYFYKQALLVAHKRLISGLRDTDWWLAAYAKRRGPELRWATETIAPVWRVPRSKRYQVSAVEVQLAEERRLEHKQFGWLDEPVKGEGRT
jgi:hypothetical protein